MLCGVTIAAIIILMVWFRRPIKESMTKIRRGVGFGNDADETQVAAGVIHSAPIMDMTHTYWDGTAHVSCDECPSRGICPRCPNMVSEYFTNEPGNWSQGGDPMLPDDRATPDVPLPMNFDELAHLEAPFDFGDLGSYGRWPGPSSDWPVDDSCRPEARVIPGACGRKGSAGRTRLDTERIGLLNNGFIGMRPLGCRGKNTAECNASPIKILYTDVLGMENIGPSPEDCLLMGEQNYLYKQSC